MAITVTRGTTYAVNGQVTNSNLHALVENMSITLAAAGDIIVGGAAGVWTDLAVGTDGQVLTAASGQTAGLAWVPGPSSSKNRLINAQFRIDQTNGGNSTATADDVYCFDQWYALTQTAAVNVSRLADPENGYTNAMRITQNQASSQRFGFAQIIEGKYCKDMRGGSGVLVPRIRASASQSIRYAILGWTSTEDAVTSDVVADWTSGTYTAGNFFLASNLTVFVVGSQTPSANTWTSLASISASLGTSFNNIVVMVWTEAVAAQNFTLDVDFVQFEQGTVATAFDRVPFDQDLAASQRYLWKTFLLDTQIKQNAGTNIGALYYRTQIASTTTGFIVPAVFPVVMRATPTVTFYNTDATNAKWRNGSGAADSGSASAAATGDRGFQAANPQVAGDAVNNDIQVHASAAAQL